MCEEMALGEIGAYLSKLQITPDEQTMFARLAQRTPEWHTVRAARLTASRAGAAVGHNPYNTPSRLLRDMLWKTFKGNAATEWGTHHEPIACDEFMEWVNAEHAEADIAAELAKDDPSGCAGVHVWETGCVVDLDHGWLAASPDGMVDVKRRDGTQEECLLEIKCPYKKVVYPQIPAYYEDQMVLQMKCTNRLTKTYFYVWTPTGSKIDILHWKDYATYWDNYLLPALRHFYVHLYLPRLLLKAAGKLEEGTVNPITTLPPSLHFDTKSISMVQDASLCARNAEMLEDDDEAVRAMHDPLCDEWCRLLHNVNIRGKPVKKTAAGPKRTEFTFD